MASVHLVLYALNVNLSTICQVIVALVAVLLYKGVVFVQIQPLVWPVMEDTTSTVLHAILVPIYRVV